MASTSPSPNSPPVAAPPASSNSTPPLPSAPPPRPPRSTPPEPSNAPPPQPNSPPPTTTPPPQPNSPPPTTTPPPQSSPPTNGASPPPALTPPPVASSPPPQPTPSPPLTITPPTSSSPPPSIPPRSPPPASPPPVPPPSPPSSSRPAPPPNPPASSPPPPSNPPASSPPLPSTNPPSNSPPPPSSIPPASPPAPPNNDPAPPPTEPPQTSAPPPSRTPPANSPPPTSTPPENSPPQPAANPPRRSPTPPAPRSPQRSPPPPTSVPPSISPTAPSRSPPASPPSSNSPPQPTLLMSPPPPPSIVPSPTNNNNSSTNAPERSQSSGDGGIGTGGTIAIVSVVVVLLLGIFALVGWCIWKRKKKNSGVGGGYVLPTSVGSSPESGSALLKVQTSSPINGHGSGFENSPPEQGSLGHSRSWFTYEELVEATNGFSQQNLLGEGGFGSVYKGCLPDGKVVAVKQLNVDGGQGEREFKSEVEIISRIHHRHLVSLVGYCISENRRLLVYDYVPNNSLYFHLHGEGRPVMNWTTRVRIAVGAARGIAYLHEDCHPRIIHRDIKSSNILLDSNFEAKVSDFGLAKLAMDTNSHITTRVMGTFGYMAPEYATSGKLTEKSDVFSYGVVLLELITGRKPVDTSQPLGEESLVEWARPVLSHALETEEFEGLVDSRLEGNYVNTEMFRMIEAAAVCVRHSAAKRPKMGQVVRVFDSMATSDLTNGMKVGESEILDSAQQSAEIRLFRRMAFGSQNYSTDFFSQGWSSEGHLANSR